MKKYRILRPDEVIRAFDHWLKISDARFANLSVGQKARHWPDNIYLRAVKPRKRSSK